MSRRSSITRANRRRQAQKEWAMFQTNGQALPHFANPIVKKLSLEVTSPDLKIFLARYGKTLLGKWKLLRCDPQLDFLRSCGRPQDARAALSRRGLVPRWF